MRFLSSHRDVALSAPVLLWNHLPTMLFDLPAFLTPFTCCLTLSTHTHTHPSATLFPHLSPQIGGSDTTDVREACRFARPYGYDAINLNCGCPSEKVAGKGAFGAALMRSPGLVKDLCLAMRDGAGDDTPITVKCRIGVDNDDSYEQLAAFVEEVRTQRHAFLVWTRRLGVAFCQAKIALSALTGRCCIASVPDSF